MTRQKPKTSLIDLVIVAANLGQSIAISKKTLDDPLVTRAIEMTTARPIDQLAQDPESLRGVLSTVKGKYFELLVEEKINSGELIETLSLNSNLKAKLAESQTQPGWDIAIVNDENKVIDQLQLKATDSVSYIAETLQRYPDIKILTTSEAAKAAGESNLVIDSGIENRDIEAVIGRAIEFGTEGTTSFLDAINPLIPLVFIMASEGYKVAIGKSSTETALDNTLNRSSHSLSGIFIGALFQSMGFGWFSVIPAVLAAKSGPKGLINKIENAISAYKQSSEDEMRDRPIRNQLIADSHNKHRKEWGIAKELTGRDIEKMRALSTGIARVDDFVVKMRAAWDEEIGNAAYDKEMQAHKEWLLEKEANCRIRKLEKYIAEKKLNEDKQKIREWADKWVIYFEKNKTCTDGVAGTPMESLKTLGIQFSGETQEEITRALTRIAEAKSRTTLCHSDSITENPNSPAMLYIYRRMHKAT